jgi:ribosomal protein L21
MKYIITQIAGKQYLFKKNENYYIILITNLKINQYIILKKILLLRKNLKLQLGYPFLYKSKILCKILQKLKKKKLTILKTKPKKKYIKIKSIRPIYTKINII